MEIFNEHSTGNTYTLGLRGPPGVAGVGFKLQMVIMAWKIKN